MTLLLDPRLLVPPGHPDSGLQEAVDYWVRILDWAADGRVKIGKESHSLICEIFAEFGYPDRDIRLRIHGLGREHQAALSRLLGRVALHSTESAECTFHPAYLGSEVQNLALQWDISGTAGTGVVGLGTDQAHWTEAVTTLAIEPGPPTKVWLCSAAGSQLPHEATANAAAFFQEKAIRVVGGHRDEGVIRRLHEELGIPEASVIWIPCERAKPPRNLDRTWGGLDPTTDLTVCITGRVGHATSNMAKATAEKRGVVHLQVEYPSDMVRALGRLADS